MTLIEMNLKDSKNLLSCLKESSGTILLAALCLLLMMSSCGKKKKQLDLEGVHVELPDTLRVGMLNSPTTYFDYRGTPMGYDYDMMDKFAKAEGIAFDVVVGGTVSEMIDWLDNGKIDILASPVSVTAEFRDRVLLCGPKMVSSQVLVQRKDSDMVTDVTALVGREVDVQDDSKYLYRMQNLNEELGGGVTIRTLDRDTVCDDDLLAMVWRGEIPMTVVDSDVAEAGASYYPGLDVSVKVSLEQYSRWAVASDSRGLAKVLDIWFGDEKNDMSQIYSKYYNLSKNAFFDDDLGGMSDLNKLTFANGRISRYDDYFRLAAKKTGFDWRLIAAIAYVESHFDANVKSWAGALGIMQVMPRTARSYGYSPDEMMDPSKCVDVAAKTLVALDRMLAKRVTDPEERINFMLAAYNSGPGHLSDAIALAEKHGLNDAVWSGNVEQGILMKSNPAYYRDPVVKNGYFRGRETVNFVKKVQSVYSFFKERT